METCPDGEAPVPALDVATGDGYCDWYHESSCCNRNEFEDAKSLSLTHTGTGCGTFPQDCQDMMSLTFCAMCSPRASNFTLADGKINFCEPWVMSTFESCRNAKICNNANVNACQDPDGAETYCKTFSEVFGTSYANFASSVDGLNGHMDTEKACFSAASSNAVTAALIAAVAALAVVFA